MNTSHILESLNMTKGESLTLEKAKDRMEFEALPLFLSSCTCNDGSTYTHCNCNIGSYDTCSCNTKVIDNCPSKGLA